MEEKNKKCWSCGTFQRFYTKGYCSLQKQKVGFCSFQNKIVGKDESCRKWNLRQRYRNMRKHMAISSIAEICNKLEVIEQILIEENTLAKIKTRNDNI